MQEHPGSTRHNEDIGKLTYFLEGVAASAIAFAMHETADREPSRSLIIIALAAAAWATSFAAGIVSTRSRMVAGRTAIALDFIEDGRSPAELSDRAIRQYEKFNRRAQRSHLIQVWALLLGALLYAAGHALHIYEAQRAAEQQAFAREFMKGFRD